MQITNFIIHRIDKESQESPTLHVADKVLDVADARVRKFTTETVSFFDNRQDRPNTVFAPFHANTDEYPLSRHCTGYFDGSIPFLDFSHRAATRLHERMVNKPSATGGYLVIAGFTRDAGRHLLIVMIHKQDGFSVNDTTLELMDVKHLDLKDIDKAALVDGGIHGEEPPEKPLTYAGFRKSLSLYFQEFLGPDRFRNPGKDSRELIQVIDEYCDTKGFDPATRDSIRLNLRRYASERSAAGEELELTAISAIVHATEPDAFGSFATDRKVSASFKPDPSVFKKWKIIHHKSTDGVTVQFPAEALGNRVIYDEAENTLTIKALEADFVKKLTPRAAGPAE